MKKLHLLIIFIIVKVYLKKNKIISNLFIYLSFKLIYFDCYFKKKRRLLFGENSISIHLTPIYALFFKEVLSPFYIFQIFSCTLWFYDDYYYYASCIVLLSSISITFSLYSIRQVIQ